ncbi:GAF and ANTAR domain-containing protein [Promicromonospora xylanilytica]
MAISAFPHELAQRAGAVLGPGLEVSMTVRQHGVTVRAGSSTPAAGRCDQAESLANSGPCIDAMDARAVRTVPSIADGDGWAAWRRQARREGFVSGLAVPAIVDDDIAVALNLYSRSADFSTPELIDAAERYARLGADMLGLNLARAELDEAAVGYYSRVSDAILTERAIWAVMQANDCPEHTAMHIIESASLRSNVSRRKIAETILRALVISDVRLPAADDEADAEAS